MIQSQSMLTMFAQELIGSELSEKSRDYSKTDLPVTLEPLFCQGEYSAMVRATAYAIGAGRVFDSQEWRYVCQRIRNIVQNRCVGWNADNIDADTEAEIVIDVRQALELLAVNFQY